MGIRKRKWTINGEQREAWVVDYASQERDPKTKRLKRHIKTFERKKDAENWAAQTHVDIAHGKHTPSSKSVTIAAAGKLWIDEGGELEKGTLEQYQQHLDLHILPFLGEVKLSALSVDVVKAWQTRLRAEGRSVAMVKKVTTSLSSLLAVAMESRKVGHNVVKSMTTTRRKKGKVERRHKRKLIVGRDIPEPAEIDLLLQHTNSERWRAFFLTAIRCGLRSSELRGLTWRDVDFKRSRLHVRQRADKWGRIGSPKSEDSQRRVPIPPATLAALQTWKLLCPKDKDGRQHFVFPTENGTVQLLGNIIRDGLKPAWERAGVTVPALDENKKPKRDKDKRPIVEPKYSGLHNLRHHFASWSLARPPVGLGLNIKELSERLGHASIQLTLDTYSHLIDRPDEHKELAAAEGRFG